MANCHALFEGYHKEIHLTGDKKESLRESRDELRELIKTYFKDTKEVSVPQFYGQGSYMMNTAVNPIDGEYDIDDGIYLVHLKDKDITEWPTAATVHNWIVDATKDSTPTAPLNKNTCVRVVYEDEYHVDLPIYIKKDDDPPKLAHKDKGWIDSDPKAFTQWFRDQVRSKGDQLRKTVQYFKAWKDHNEGDTKLPSGMVLTVLAAEHFVGYDDRDDSTLVATAQAIYDALSENFSINKPVVPNEDLLEGWSDTKKTNFLNKLNNLISKGSSALEKEDQLEASKEWIKVLGERFPEGESTPPENSSYSKSAKTTSQPAILGNHGRSA